MTIEQDILYNPEPEQYAKYLMKPINELHRSWVRNVGIHIEATCERDHVDAREARSRLRVFAVLTGGRNRYNLRNIATKLAGGEKYEEILRYAKEIYGGIESVRQWLMQEPDAQEELQERGVSIVDWF